MMREDRTVDQPERPPESPSRILGRPLQLPLCLWVLDMFAPSPRTSNSFFDQTLANLFIPSALTLPYKGPVKHPEVDMKMRSARRDAAVRSRPAQAAHHIDVGLPGRDRRCAIDFESEIGCCAHEVFQTGLEKTFR
jgi:hypothetical protein